MIGVRQKVAGLTKKSREGGIGSNPREGAHRVNERERYSEARGKEVEELLKVKKKRPCR